MQMAKISKEVKKRTVMTIESLNYFIEIAKGKTFLEVSEEYHLSQSSLSREIKKLEEEMGTQLLDRSKRSAALTPAGEYFYNNINTIMPFLNKVLQNMSLMYKRPHINCCVLPYFTIRNLQNIIGSFADSHPHLQITTSCETDYTVLENLLTKGEIDFAIFYKKFSKSAEPYNYISLLNEDILLLMSPSHPLAMQNSISLSDLKGENIFMSNWFHTMSMTYPSIREALQGQITYDLHREAILLKVLENNGIAIMPAPDVACFRLDKIICKTVSDFPEIPLILAYTRDLGLFPVHKEFAQYLQKALTTASGTLF